MARKPSADGTTPKRSSCLLDRFCGRARDRHPDTKQRLLEAAVRIFAAKGYLSTTVRDICAEAGANGAAVNYHFGDKNQLYAAVLHHIFGEHHDLGELFPPLPPGASAEERLERHIHIAVRKVYHDANCPGPGSPAPIFLMEMARPSEHLGGIVDRYIRADHEKLKAILGDLLGPAAPRALVEQAEDFVWGALLMRLFTLPIDRHLGRSSEPGDDLEGLARDIIDFTLGGLAALRGRLDAEKDTP